MSAALEHRIAAGLAAPVAPPVRAFAEQLASDADALAVLFYGSNLRTGSLEGVLDYYVLLPGAPERGIWPRVSYHETGSGGETLRAKVATMTLAKFAEAASGALIDTTIWARFVQPSALVWRRDAAMSAAVIAALAAASATAARLAAVVGPDRGREDDYWTALFRATYRAEFRVEDAGRERSILALNPRHFDGLLPLALEAAGIAFEREGDRLVPLVGKSERAEVQRWWRRRRRLGKPLNLLRLLRASSTFDGAARYAAWKVERHTGVAVKLTPWRERHPVLAAPGVLWTVWRARRKT
jgi:hypothetical protein